jgi:hypothetical protein
LNQAHAFKKNDIMGLEKRNRGLRKRWGRMSKPSFITLFQMFWPIALLIELMENIDHYIMV